MSGRRCAVCFLSGLKARPLKGVAGCRVSLELADEERSLVAALARDDNERKEGAKAKTKGRSRSFAVLRMTARGKGLVQA